MGSSTLLSDPDSPGLSAFKNNEIPQTARLPVAQDMLMGDLALSGVGAYNNFRSRNAGFHNQGYNTDVYGNQESFNQEHGNLEHSGNVRYIQSGYGDQGNTYSTEVSALCNNFDNMNFESQAHVGSSNYHGEPQSSHSQRRSHRSHPRRNTMRDPNDCHAMSPQSQTHVQNQASRTERRSSNRRYTSDALARWYAYLESKANEGSPSD